MRELLLVALLAGCFPNKSDVYECSTSDDCQAFTCECDGKAAVP